MACPNINLDSWKNLVAARGEAISYYLWDRYDGNVPQEEYSQETKEDENKYFQIASNLTTPAIKELDNFLLDFLKGFNVKTKEFEELKSRLGIDALGATDVLNKLIWYVKNRNEETLPEEAAHMLVALMGEKHPDINDLLSNITNWSEYNDIKKKYLPIYKDETKVKIEAVGKLIAKALVKNYKANGLDKTKLQKALQNILDYIESIFDSLNLSSVFFYNENIADHVAINVLSGNKDYIYKITNLNSNLNAQKEIEKNPNAKSVIRRFSSDDVKMTGSLAIAGTENIRRPEGQGIHDLDFKVKSFEVFDKEVSPKIPENAVPAHYGWHKKSYSTFAYLIPNEGYRIQVLERKDDFSNGWITNYKLYNEKNEEVEITQQNVIAVDFFVYKEGVNQKDFDFDSEFIPASLVYEGKMSLGGKSNPYFFSRDKDQEDYVLRNPKSFIPFEAHIYYQLNDETPSAQEQLASITPKLNIVNYRTMDDKSKEDAVDGVEEAQRRWVEEEIAEFYEAVEQYNKGLDTFSSKGVNKGKATMDDVIDETLGIFRTIQMFPKFAGLIRPYVNDIKIALRTFGRKEGYAIYKAKKDAKGQAQDMTYENLFEVVDQYLSDDNIMLQTEDMPMSKASPETINKVKEVLKKMGVNVQALVEYAKQNPAMDLKSVSGVADLVRGVIAIAEGKEDVALTEEMVHIATAILEQTNPKMVTEMISKIDRFQIYQRTLEAYKNNKNYQLSNGKPDIRKIKKEAVDKLIAELIINNNEGTTEFPELRDETNRSIVRNWWNSILDFVRGMYRKSNIEIFEEAAGLVETGEVGGTVSNIERQDVFFQITPAQQRAIDAITSAQKKIKKREEKVKEADPLLLDSEEANNFYEMEQPDGTFVKIINRVTDRVKAWYKQRFGNKEFTAAEKMFNELKRTYGVRYHGFFEEIHNRYFNKDGTKKAKEDPRAPKLNQIDQEVYDKLEKYYTDLINLLPEGTIVLSEVIVYDPKAKEAGTIDFLAIEPSGKAHILDWKFMYISSDPRNDDVAWFKQGAYNIQLGRYKQMLKDNYGIKEFGMLRAIPFLMNFEKENPMDPKSNWYIKGISAGSADKSKITNLKLMPVAEQTESTGYEELDTLIRKLNSLLNAIGKQSIVDETEREFKIERMNTIRRAIRIVQGSMNIAPLIDVIEVMRKDGERLLEDYNITYKDKISTREDFNDKDLSNFAEEMNNYVKFSEMFTQISALIGDLIYTDDMLANEKTEEGKETVRELKGVLQKLQDEQTQITKLRMKLEEAQMSFADKHVGQRNLVGGLMSPEAIVKGLSSLFRGVSELPTAALRLLYKITTAAKGKAMAESLNDVQELMAIREKLAKRGGDLRKLVRKLYQSDEKKGLVNKLIYKYKKEFYDIMKEKKEAGGSKKWLLDNINVDEYKEEALAKMNENIERLKKRRFRGTPEQEEETRNELILEEKQRWDIDRKDFNGWDNYILKRHPKDIWFSDDYNAIKGDADLLKLYNYISKLNEKSKDIGYINGIVSATFLPFVRKTMAEELIWDHTISPLKNFSKSLQIKADDVGYGQFDELTGELENSIPKYYTHDFSRTENGVNDYSDVSEDLFKNLILYIQQVNKYKYLSEVEGQIKLLKTVEEFKGHIQTNRTGNVVLDAAGNPQRIPNKNENAKLFDDFMRTLLYEQKYVLSDADTPMYMNNVLNGVKKVINRVAGRELWKEGQADKASSLVKSMDAMNKAFQLKILGLDPISGTVNAFGGNIQIATQAGNYFQAREFLKNEFKLSGMKFKSKVEQDLFMQSVELFMPMKDDPSYEMLKKAGMSVGTRGSTSDFLMAFMRTPEQLLEKSVFETLLQNMMVENGKIVSIREFVRSKYKGRSKSAAEYRTAKENIEKEVNELKSKRSIAVTRKLENGKLVIPGLDLNNREEIQRLTNLTRRISRNATGGIADGDINRMSMSVWTKSMMVFRGWIPKLADTRFSEFRKVSDDFSVRVNDQGEIEGEKYDIGRIRLLGSVMMDSLTNAQTSIVNILSMNEKGIEAIDRLYEQYAKEYKEKTGEDLNMDRDEFTDLIRTNLRNQIKELMMLATLISIGFALGFFEPDDEEDKATKNRFRYVQKVVDKFISELSFFYNPLNFEQVLSGSTFPALGLITDFTKFIGHFFEEITGFDFSNPSRDADEVREKAKPLKYVMKNVPTGRTFMSFMSIFSDDFARDFDITIQRESNMK
jgi:hypothetical protein